MNNQTKIVFIGTPDFAIPALKTLVKTKDFVLPLVITQPDKPGNKNKMTPTPIKIAAEELGLNVQTPMKFREVVDEIREIDPDLFVVVAYGKIIPEQILKLARHGSVNIHPSLLPRHRGPAPVAATILEGDELGGVSVMLLDVEMDHGPILNQETIELEGNERREQLTNRLFDIGAKALPKIISDYLADKLPPEEQDHPSATFCKMIKKEHGQINWSDPAWKIERQIRAYEGWPTSYTFFVHKGKKIRLTILEAEIADGMNEKQPGTAFLNNDRLLVSTGMRFLELKTIQVEGKKPMDATAFSNGYMRGLETISFK